MPPSLLHSKRQGLHAGILAAFEAHEDTPAEILAHHATQAGETRKALLAWKQAGANALSRPAYQEALGHLRQAVRLSEQLDDRDWAHDKELELQIQIGQACIANKGWGGNETDTAFERALELVDLVEESPLRLPAIYGKFAVQYVRGEDSRPLVRRFQATTESTPDDGVQLIALRMRTLTHLRDGEFEAAHQLTQQSILSYDASRHRDLAYRYSYDARMAALVYGSWALWHLGFPEQATANKDAALVWAEEFGHAGTSGMAQCWGGVFFDALARNVAGAKARARASIELADTLEMPDWLGWSRVFQGWALSLDGDLLTGRQEIDRGIAELRANRCTMLMPILLSLSAETHALSGQLDNAHQDLDDGFEVLERTSYPAWRSHLHLMRAQLHTREPAPDPELVQQHLNQAINVARGQQAKMIELRASTLLTRVRANNGDASQARAQLASVYNTFTEGFDSADLREARELLEQLA